MTQDFDLGKARAIFLDLLGAGEFTRAKAVYDQARVHLLDKRAELAVAVEKTTSLREKQKLGAELAETIQQIELLDDDFRVAEEDAAVKALNESSLVLRTYRENVQDLDKALLKALSTAWKIYNQRMEAERRRDEAQKRYAFFGLKYPFAGVKVWEGRGMQTSWGRPLSGNEGEVIRSGFIAYADRFSKAPTTDLADFNKRAV